MTAPETAAPPPPGGAEARSSKPTCVGLDGPRKGRVSRPCGLQGALAAWQSQFRGGHWVRPHDARNLSLRISGHS
jgi:hypothetical protein